MHLVGGAQPLSLCRGVLRRLGKLACAHRKLVTRSRKLRLVISQSVRQVPAQSDPGERGRGAAKLRRASFNVKVAGRGSAHVLTAWSLPATKRRLRWQSWRKGLISVTVSVGAV